MYRNLEPTSFHKANLSTGPHVVRFPRVSASLASVQLAFNVPGGLEQASIRRIVEEALVNLPSNTKRGPPRLLSLNQVGSEFRVDVGPLVGPAPVTVVAKALRSQCAAEAAYLRSFKPAVTFTFNATYPPSAVRTFADFIARRLQNTEIDLIDEILRTDRFEGTADVGPRQTADGDYFGTNRCAMWLLGQRENAPGTGGGQQSLILTWESSPLMALHRLPPSMLKTANFHPLSQIVCLRKEAKPVYLGVLPLTPRFDREGACYPDDRTGSADYGDPLVLACSPNSDMDDETRRLINRRVGNALNRLTQRFTH